MNNIEETAIQDEQRLHESIMDEIVKVIANHNMTVRQAEKLLYHTIDRVKEQKVTSYLL